MGISGLTTFIDRLQKCMEYYKLQNTYLVIDGNSLTAQLYVHKRHYDYFGGDYDVYAKDVENFFNMLLRCNVVPLVVFDGGYENKKYVTIFKRFKERVQSANPTRPTSMNGQVFPLFIRELFICIVQRLNIKMVRCDFEADLEMARIAKLLNCPVLSYDSDFYVLDVLYIPFSTVDLRTNCNYVPCKIYKTENFLKLYSGMQKEVLPLLSTILGNDYIKIRVFHAFYAQLKPRNRKGAASDRQRRIAAVIEWLRTETYESALRKILGRVRLRERKRIYNEITKVTSVYDTSEPSQYLKVLNVEPTLRKRGDINFVRLSAEEIHSLEAGEVHVESCESSKSSDEDEDQAELVEEQKEEEEEQENKCSLPAWFIDKYRLGYYPACFMDFAVRNTYFMPAQSEDYSQEYSHKSCLRIIQVLHRILSYGQERSLVYLTRKGTSAVKYNMPPENCFSISLDEIPHLPLNELQAAFLEVLQLTNVKLDGIPQSWQLVFLSIIYWINNALQTINESHIYALCLSMLSVFMLDKELGYCRDSREFNRRFRLQLNVISSKEKQSPEPGELEKMKSMEEAMKLVDADDCILHWKTIFRFFKLAEKIDRNPKFFDASIVHAFAAYQSCNFHIRYLNLMLQCPYRDAVISDFYNGMLVYNLCANFVKRSNLHDYVSGLLSNSPSVLRVFNSLVAAVKANVYLEINKSSAKKRRKRKNRGTESVAEVEDTIESSEEELYDENNRFALLKSCKH